MLPYINKWNHVFDKSDEIKPVLEYFADKGCLGFLIEVGASNAFDFFTLVFKHENEKILLDRQSEGIYVVTDLTNRKEKTYFKHKALSVVSDIVIDRMIDDVRQKLAVKFDDEISDDLKGVWNVFLSDIHNGFIHELYRLDKDSRNFWYDDEDKDIQIDIFNDKVSMCINENGSVLVETTEHKSFTGYVGELEFTKQLNETLTYFSNLD